MKTGKAGQHIPTLDGLRAVSFLLVFVSHTRLIREIPGGFGVTVFFFLSGFLITTLMRREWDKIGTLDVKHFYLRRALRILPPFYLVLIVASLMTAAGVFDDGKIEWKGFLSQAVHFSNYWVIINGWPRGMAPGTSVFWSLAVEEHFYLLFPFVFLAFRRARLSSRMCAVVLWGFCLAILLWRLHLVAQGASTARTNIGSDTRFDSILFGCALALWGNPVLDGPVARPLVWKWILLPLGLGALLFTFVHRGDPFRETYRYTIQGIALIPVFVCGIEWPRMPIFRVLNWRPIAFMGVLSYSLYLVHFIVLSCLESRLPAMAGVPRAAMALALSVLAARLIYEIVEKPCARLRARLAVDSSVAKQAGAAVGVSRAAAP
jgi:peptidoglycan/LPS O-acetylase OafA/YrhL